tara:strand:- start:338 stop:979 length:642 start_codon:yes stop_codon:yes gene_type:complete
MANSSSGCAEFLFQEKDSNQNLVSPNPGLSNQFSVQGGTCQSSINKKNSFNLVPVILGTYQEKAGSTAISHCVQQGWINESSNTVMGGWVLADATGEPSFDSSAKPTDACGSGGTSDYRYKYTWTWQNSSINWITSVTVGWKRYYSNTGGLPSGSTSADIWHVEAFLNENDDQDRCVVLFLGVQEMTGGNFGGNAVGAYDSAVMPLIISQTNY